LPDLEFTRPRARLLRHLDQDLSCFCLSLFPRLVASVTRLTGVPIEWSMLLWFAFAQFLLLWAAYELAEQCFRSERARWAGIGLLAVLLSVPVAGTALIIADSYLTARSLSTPLVMMAVACFLGQTNSRGLPVAALRLFDSSADGNLRSGIRIDARIPVAIARACRSRGRSACASSLVNLAHLCSRTSPARPGFIRGSTGV